MPARHAVQHVSPVGKHISHVVENCKAHIVLDKRQRRRWKPQFEIIQKQRRTTQGKAGNRVTRARLIQAEAAMRVAASHKEALGQWNQSRRSAEWFSRLSNDGI